MDLIPQTSAPVVDLFDRFLQERIYLKGVSSETLRYYRWVRRAFQPILSEPTKSGMMERITSLLADGVSPTSVNTYLRGFKAYVRWLHQEGYLRDVIRVEFLRAETKVLATFSAEHIRNLIVYRPTLKSERRSQAIALVILDTGLRIGETLRLRKDAVDFDNMLLQVRGKGNRVRKVPFSSECRKVLFKICNRHDHELVFCTSNGSPVTQRNFLRDFKTLAAKQAIQRLDNIIRDGLDPRIRHTSKAIPLGNGNYAVIIRSEQSWYGPHRVIFKGDGRFWARTSNGKYELDVTELRNAFLFSNTVTERVAAFRAERVIALENGRSLVPLPKGPLLALHCMPVESFSSKRSLDVTRLLSLESVIRPMGRKLSGSSVNFNFEGIICTAHGDVPSAYTQVYRNGVIEAVGEGFLTGEKEGLIPSVLYEGALLQYLPHCFSVLNHIGCRPPVVVGISLIGVLGHRMYVDFRLKMSLGAGDSINRDVLVLPDILVEDLSTDPAALLRPTFDMVWNACGYPASLNFDANGKWKPPS